MKLAVMQPYFLPYIGYFQLMSAVDKFVAFDDVNFIKGGWINRNRLLLNGAPHTFTVPLRGASQNRLISDIELVEHPDWRRDLLSTIRMAYRRAPHYERASSLLEGVICHPATRLTDFLFNSLRELMSYLAIDAKLVNTSAVYGNSHLKGFSRILDICKQENAATYVNPIGGVDLYDRAAFAEHGVELRFLKPRPVTYSQGPCAHVPWLSILDVIMFNDPTAIRRFLVERDLE